MKQTLREFVDTIPCDLSRVKELFDRVPKEEYTDHVWYDSRLYSVNLRECTSSIYAPDTDSEVSMELFHVVDKCLIEYQKKRPSMDPLSNSSVGRFNIYREGDSMDRHVDHIYSLFTPPTQGIPVLSFVGLLEDDYEGGEMILCDEEIPLRKGDVVVFPSCFLFPHEIKKVTSGRRVSFVSWAW